MDKLIEELKLKIIETLYLEDVKPEDIQPETPLFADGLGLDSIDALEIVMLIEKSYNVKIDNKEIGQKVLRNLSTLAAYIRENDVGE